MRLGAAVTVIGALAVTAPSASAWVVREPDGHLVSVALTSGSNPASIPGSIATQRAANGVGLAGASSTGPLLYGGGPVLHSVAPYLIFWTGGESIQPTTELLLARYFADSAADSEKATNVYAVARQFYDATGFADYRQTFTPAQVLTDTDPFPPHASDCPVQVANYPTCITDGQIQAELASFVGPSHPTGIGSNAPVYFVVTPSDVNVCLMEAVCNSTADPGGICAYHAPTFTGTTGILYASVPLFFDGDSHEQMPKRCQADGNASLQEPNNDLGDVAIKYMSHEFSETITDPLLNAWLDANGGEDGDKCNSVTDNANAFLPTLGGKASSGTLFNQLINGHGYYTQGEWSNGLGNCAMRPPDAAMTAGVSGPAVAALGRPTTFTPSGTSLNGYSSVTVDFGDGGASFDSSGSGTTPAVHTYTQEGSFVVGLTAVDTTGNLVRASTNVLVRAAPNPAFSLAPRKVATGVRVRFRSMSSDPDSGVRIVSTRFEFGDGRAVAGAKATHVYARPGTYTVTLAVVNSLGLISTTTHRIKIVRAKITKVRFDSNDSELAVTVNAPGRLIGVGTTKKAKKAGTYKLTLSGGQLATLAGSGQVRITIKFKPAAGKTFTKTVTV